MIIDGIEYRTCDYSQNEIRASSFHSDLVPLPETQNRRFSDSGKTFFWETEPVDINPNQIPVQHGSPTWPPQPLSYIVCRLWSVGTQEEQDDGYGWDRTTVMHGTGRQLWLEYVRVWQIFLLQYKPHNIHAHQDQQILLHCKCLS